MMNSTIQERVKQLHEELAKHYKVELARVEEAYRVMPRSILADYLASVVPPPEGGYVE